ncbi:MAG: YihY/virulence factor BrkB family protein [Thermomicrobiales bacterium]|nr:YihY/virulence factor BrkB family protein [Thermomicrobiales bacterium]
MTIPGFADQAPLQVMKRAVKNFIDDDMLTYAAALSYHILLALFPFIIFLLALLGAVGATDLFDQLLEQARLALPPDAFSLLSRVINEIRGAPRGGLLSVSILFSLWAASGAVRSLMDSLNVAYDVKETRPAWKRYPLSIVYTVGLAVLVVAAAAATLVGPRTITWLAEHAGLSGAAALLWRLLRWPVIILVLLLAIAIVTPNIDQPFRFVTPGAVTGIVVWIIATIGFSAYVDNFGNYGATYGSLGGMVVLLIYFFVSSAVLLLGAEINAVIHPVESPGVKGPAEQPGDDGGDSSGTTPAR